MSFFKLDDNNISYDNNIKYTYKDTTINKRDIKEHSNDNLHNSIKNENIPEVEGKLIPLKHTFYKINFPNKEANFVYTDINPSSYVANTIYLYSVLHHNISGVTTNNKDIIGEIVIEHSNPNEQNQKIYTCFLIKEELVKTTDNSIDKIINLVEGNSDYNELSFELKTDIPTQTHCFHYEDKKNHVFVYTNPISVKKNAASFFKNKLANKTKLFNIYPARDDKIVSYQLIKLGKIEGFVSKTINIQEGMANDEGEIWIDCQPAGESDETIQARNVPLNSEYVDSKDKIDFFKTIIHFLVFIIVTIVSVLGASSLYKTLIIDMINKLHKGDDDNNKYAFMSKSNLLILVIFIGVGLLSLVAGLKTGLSGGNDYLKFYGIFLIGFTVISFAAIKYRISNEPEFIKTGDIKIPTTGTFDNMSMHGILGSLSFLWECLKSTDKKKALVILVVTGLCLIGIPALQMDSTTYNKWVTPLSLTTGLILTPIFYMASTTNAET